jgi:UDP-N-acetylmuramoylalanine--D-glutamate ligase
MVQTLSQFTGLPHRCQWVREHRAVSWFNDSKGTNVGATLAAINGLNATQTGEAKMVLIAGGQSKGQSFADLKQPLISAARAVILIGEDAQQIGAQIEHPNTQYAANMDEAVRLAASAAVAGDLVLLSPACASFDMFSGYEARGDRFVELVEALA